MMKKNRISERLVVLRKFLSLMISIIILAFGGMRAKAETSGSLDDLFLFKEKFTADMVYDVGWSVANNTSYFCNPKKGNYYVAGAFEMNAGDYLKFSYTETTSSQNKINDDFFTGKNYHIIVSHYTADGKLVRNLGNNFKIRYISANSNEFLLVYNDFNGALISDRDYQLTDTVSYQIAKNTVTQFSELTDFQHREYGHSGGQATHTQKAVCLFCGEGYGETIPHTYDKMKAINDYLASSATCQAKATYYKSCECGAKGTETFETGTIADHAYGMLIEEVPATHMTEGVKAHYTCSVCKKNFDSEKAELSDLTIAKTPEHTFAKEVVAEEYRAGSATCLAKAKYYYSCECGEKGTDTFESGDYADHAYGTLIEESPATHMTEGVKEHYTCSVCKKNFDSEKAELSDLTIAKTPEHTFDKEVVAEEYLAGRATCLEKAKYFYSCECGEKGTDTFKSGDYADHMYGTLIEEVPAAHMTEGVKAHYTCSKCKKNFDSAKTELADLTIANTPEHRFDKEVVAEGYLAGRATCLEKAKYFYSCECGEKGTDTFKSGDYADHVYGTLIEEVPAAHMTEGVKEHYTCSVCKKNFDSAKKELSDLTIAKLVKPEEIKQEEPASVEPEISEGSAQKTEQEILSAETDDDPADASFSILQAKMKKAAKSKMTISWNKVEGAAYYDVYGGKCGTKYEKLGSTTGVTYTRTELAKGTSYKYMVVAVDHNNMVLAKSKVIHIYTTGGKYTNLKTVKVSKSKVSLKVNKSAKIKTKVVAVKKTLKLAKHRKLAFESTDPNVAVVSAKGKITGVSKGSCLIYVYAQNGVAAKVRVTVK